MMKRVGELSQEEVDTLQEAIKHCEQSRVRQRAQAVLWSSMGYCRTEISRLLFVVPDVVSHWLDKWQEIGLAGLYDETRSGRPPVYSEADVQLLKTLVDESPQHLRQVQAKMAMLTGKTASVDTLKRLLKKHSTIGGNVVEGALPNHEIKTLLSPNNLGSNK